MFAWIARLLRRTQKPLSGSAPDHAGTESGPTQDLVDVSSPACEVAPVPQQQADAGDAERVIRRVDYALLLTDSGSLENVPDGARYLDLARQHGGVIQPSVSGLTLVLFEAQEGDDVAPGRLDFAAELEKKSLARIRCLHGQSLARCHASGKGEITLLNFHVVVQHAAALDLGTVTEAGSYHAAGRARARRKPPLTGA